MCLLEWCVSVIIFCFPVKKIFYRWQMVANMNIIFPIYFVTISYAVRNSLFEKTYCLCLFSTCLINKIVILCVCWVGVPNSWACPHTHWENKLLAIIITTIITSFATPCPQLVFWINICGVACWPGPLHAAQVLFKSACIYVGRIHCKYQLLVTNRKCKQTFGTVRKPHACELVHLRLLFTYTNRIYFSSVLFAN